ncbi:Thymus-specific serine protease, partial [Blyttiomyces sp. JEL0837]
MHPILTLLVILFLSVTVNGLVPWSGVLQNGMIRQLKDNIRKSQQHEGRALPTVKTGFYSQKVDHFGYRKGASGSRFQQWYAIVDQYYRPGGPVFYYIEGESAASPTDIQYGLAPQLASNYGGLIVTLEHRFYGAPSRSVPTANLSLASLKLLTSKQALADSAEFITNFPKQFPQYNITKTTKWISIGGSYPGALSAFLREKYPNLIFASHASSGVVLAETDFWRYSYAVDAGMSKEPPSGSPTCAQGFTRAVKVFDDNLDAIVQSNNKTALIEFQSTFWLGVINDIGQFASFVTTVLASTIQYGSIYDYYQGSYPNGVRMIDAVCSGTYFPAFVDSGATDDDLLDALRGLTIGRLQHYGFTGSNDPNLVVLNMDYNNQDESLNNVNRLWIYQ